MIEKRSRVNVAAMECVCAVATGKCEDYKQGRELLEAKRRIYIEARRMIQCISGYYVYIGIM